MGITEAFKAWRRGESATNSFGYLFVSDAEIERGRGLDSQLEALNRQAFEAGTYNQSQYELAAGNAAAGATDRWFTDPATSPGAGFVDGAAEGLAAEQAAVQKATSNLIGKALGFLPWQAWVAILLFLAWRFGLLRRVMGKLSPA